jgi:hypothetical protein
LTIKKPSRSQSPPKGGGETVRTALLRSLFRQEPDLSQGSAWLVLDEWAAKNAYQTSQAETALQSLCAEGLAGQSRKMAHPAPRPIATLTPAGYIHVDSSILSADERYADVRLRLELLSSVNDVAASAPGSPPGRFYQHVEDKLGNDCLWEACQVLQARGMLSITRAADKSLHLDITTLGAATWAAHAEFAGLEGGDFISTQERGHRLEHLLHRVISADGWVSTRNALSAGEENDLIIRQAREYHIVQCKWQKPAVSAAQMRDFKGRLINRAGVAGVYFSMSGFTRGSLIEARDSLGTRIVLLFGKDDIHALTDTRGTFAHLLDEKMDSAVLHRRILVDGLAVLQAQSCPYAEPIRGRKTKARPAYVLQ